MSFQNRAEFIEAAASEKITLAQVEGRKRIINWTTVGAGVYKKIVDNYVLSVHNGNVALNQASSSSVAAGDFFYDSLTGELFIHLIGSIDPADQEIIATFQFHFASRTLDLPFDLVNTSPHTSWDGRITSSPGYNHSIGVEQKLTSVVGSGTLKLENNDGGLDGFYDTHIFENQRVRIYSYNPDLSPDEAKIIFRGRVTNKAFSSSGVSFTVKDLLFDLEQQLPQSVFDDTDNVADNVKGKIKRWVYGRVDGLRIQSVDQIANGVALTGTISGNTTSLTLTGVGTSFLSELSPDDVITAATQEFTVESVESDTSLTLTDEPDFAFEGATATYIPEIPITGKNRVFFVADHETAQLTKTVVNALQLNRVELNDTTGILAGDFLEFTDLSEKVEVKNVAPGNIVVLRQNLSDRPSASTSAIREPIQDVFIEGVRVLDEDFTITNSTTTQITLDALTEFNLARTISFGTSFTFTNGTRTITTTDDVDLRETFSPRDWIRPAGITYTTFYEILSVEEQTITIRTTFADPTTTDTAQVKFPSFIGDDTIMSVNVLGRTESGDKAGVWIDDVASTVKDIVTQIGITDINTSSFTTGSVDNKELVSIAFPIQANSASLTKAKTALDLLNKSIQSAVTLDNDLNLKFKVLNVEIPESPTILKDCDVKSWSVKATNGKGIRNTIISYRFQDIDRTTLESGNQVQTYDNTYVRDFIGTNKTGEFNVYLFNESSARIMSHRLAYFSELGRADIDVTSDLRLENIEIGQTVQLEFERLYKRFGDSTSRKKTAVVVGKKVDGQEIKLKLTDLNNTYNTACIITPNTAPDFSAATEDQKLTFGYITTVEGIVDDNEDTQNTNLIT